MHSLELDRHQEELACCPLNQRVFLEGPAGTGKTRASVGRLLHLLTQGTPADQILVLVPQQTLGTAYEQVAADTGQPQTAAGGLVSVLTMGGVAQRAVDLFWPIVAERACFAHPRQPPVFLTLETAQYFMARLAAPLLKQGYFETINVERNRLYSQILDNLNKAAVVGFSHVEISSRLKASWIGDKSQLRVFDEAQECAARFREYCLAHNLLDFSLQMEVFAQYLWPLPACHAYLTGRYRHLIVENVEEDTPLAHDVLRAWLADCGSAWLVYDWDAGYRRFLGADPGSAHMLSDLCPRRAQFTRSYVTSPGLRSLLQGAARSLNHGPDGRGSRQPTAQGTASGPAVLALHESAAGAGIVDALHYQDRHRYYPQMIAWVGEQIEDLVQRQGVPPQQIAVLAPFLSDALRFWLVQALESHGIAARSHRPSRALREEPAAQCLLTLAALGHPAWGIVPPPADVAQALRMALDGLDLVRAQLMAKTLYRARPNEFPLGPFERLRGEMQERITYRLGGRYETLRTWLADYAAGQPAELDHFLSRLFGEVLSQTGFGFHRNLETGRVAANLVESVRKFRRVAVGVGRGGATPDDAGTLGAEYVRLVQDGVVAAQYVEDWRLPAEGAVLLSPAYTFLMTNRPVDYQFWLDVGSTGWWERVYQPLTHPHVLSRAWLPGTLWNDSHEYAARQDALYALVSGLIRRCRRRIYLGLCDLGEEGIEQKGPLLRVFQGVLRRMQG